MVELQRLCTFDTYYSSLAGWIKKLCKSHAIKCYTKMMPLSWPQGCNLPTIKQHFNHMTFYTGKLVVPQWHAKQQQSDTENWYTMLYCSLCFSHSTQAPSLNSMSCCHGSKQRAQFAVSGGRGLDSCRLAALEPAQTCMFVLCNSSEGRESGVGYFPLSSLSISVVPI